MDFAYPLPKESLHARYDGLFAAFKKGLSSSFISLPHSGKIALLKFVLHYSHEFLAEFINPKDYFFIEIDDAKLSAEQLTFALVAKIKDAEFITINQKEDLKHALSTNDSFFCLLTLENILAKISEPKIILFLYRGEELFDFDPRNIEIVAKFWKMNRNSPPKNLVRICIAGNPTILEKQIFLAWDSVRTILEENTCEFALLSPTELDYLRKRQENILGVKIPTSVHTLASRISGGNQKLYKAALTLSEADLKHTLAIHNHPGLDSIVNAIWDGTPLIDRQNVTRNFSPLLPPKKQLTEISQTVGAKLPQMTAQEKVVFDFLTDRESQVVSREEIGQIIWGKLWQEKYSDWAIDRTVANLRKKLAGTKFSVITLRNRGYKLATI